MGYKIIVVNYNGYLDTLECLESLLKSTYQNFQVFIIDNSEKNKDFEGFKQWSEDLPIKIETNFPDIIYPLFQKTSIDILFLTEKELEAKTLLEQKIIFIRANENKGFSAANNIALKHIQKQDKFGYIWLLNNDTVVPIYFLQNTEIRLKKNNSNNGVIGNALCYYDNPEILQCVANKCNNWLAHTFPVYEKTEYQKISTLVEDKPLYKFSPIGASMFIKRECFKEIGLLEEAYFLYFEEWDYTIRAEKKNWRTVIFVDVFIYHKQGATIDKGNKEGMNKTLFSDYYLLKNKLVFARKNLKLYHLPTVYLSYLPVIINRIRRKQWDRVIMIIKIIVGLKVDIK